MFNRHLDSAPPIVRHSLGVLASALLLGACAQEPVASSGLFDDKPEPPAMELEMSKDGIVGGQTAQSGTYPYIVYAGGCGGTLIGSSWVMTAAHCSSNFSVGSYLNIGGYSISGMNNNTSGEWRQVAQRSCHPSYNSSSNDYDFCIVRLSSASSKTPLPIEISDIAHTGQNAAIAGWGRTSQNGGSPNTLREAVVPILSPAQCAGAYNNITTRMVCAGYAQGGIDTCQGDSGGPLIGLQTGTLIGVTSWGVGCAQPRTPGVYARVNRVTGWICDTTNDEAVGCTGSSTGGGTTGGGTTGGGSGTCAVAQPSWVGDGYCDGGDYNVEDCGYDGGDCCATTCQDADYPCGQNGYQCADPLGTQLVCEAPTDAWIGDGYCDDSADYNNEACGYDGGDCCSSTCSDANYPCGYNGFQCIDPLTP